MAESPPPTLVSSPRSSRGHENHASAFGADAYGRIEFPSSKKPPAKWVKLSAKAGAHSSLARLVREYWRVAAPSVVISVAGSADELTLNDKQKLVFRRGLLAAARMVSRGSDEGGRMVAWILTGGTDAGVSALVGKTMQGASEDDDLKIACIGVAPWGVVDQREHLARPASTSWFGARYTYGSVNRGTESAQTGESAERTPLDPNHRCVATAWGHHRLGLPPVTTACDHRM